MKVLLCSVLLFVLTVAVTCERCSDVSQCSLTQCADTAKVICERGECTCQVPRPQRCFTQRDCGNLPPCDKGAWHCVDNQCTCY